jgi:acetyl-CoA acetyltransferase family protein
MTRTNETAVVIDTVRSSIGRGKATGAFAQLHAVELLSQVIVGLVERTGIDPGAVDDVLIGCVSQAGEQAVTPGRMAWLSAGYPAHVPATTIDRRCGSGQQAIVTAAYAIMAGAYDMAIAGGLESMSRVPMGSARMDADPFGAQVQQRFAPGLVPQGVSAELVAAKWSLDRDALDAYAAASHQRAAAAAAAGAFAAEIVPIQTAAGLITADETIRPDSTPESLGALRPAFEHPDYTARFPEIHWSITAGNSSQISDGAAAALVMSETLANRLGLQPRARFVADAVVGDDPLLMLTGPIPATEAVLARAGLAVTDIDHIEVNEAFAPVPLAWQAEFDADPERLNPRGGAIALGHPLGASGARLFATMLHALEQSGGRYGLQTMCEAGGMANATIIERL